jgi:rRNA-processing protein EBP2
MGKKSKEKELSPDLSQELESFIQEINQKKPKNRQIAPSFDEDSDESDEVQQVQSVKRHINNKTVLLAKLKDMQLNLPFEETLSITSPLQVDDVNDDLKRELAFYAQALSTVTVAKKLAEKQNIPFTRPNDYFAEMVKTDEQMGRIRQRLLDEQQSVKAAEDRKKLRDAKKFGKQVQVQKQLERQKQKTESLDKIKSLKRKRRDGKVDADDFDVELDQVLTDKPGKKVKGNPKRDAKNNKYGSGGKKRGMKSNTRESLDNVDAPRSFKKGNVKSPKGRPSRPGKNARSRGRGKR